MPSSPARARASGSRPRACSQQRARGSSRSSRGGDGPGELHVAADLARPGEPERVIGEALESVRPRRLPRQQRRLGGDPPVRRAHRGDLGALMADQRDERRPREPGRAARHAGARRRSDRQRLLDRGEAPLDRECPSTRSRRPRCCRSRG